MRKKDICRIYKVKWTIRVFCGVGLLGLLLGLGSLYSYGAVGVSPLIYVLDTSNSRIVRINNMTGAGWVAFGTSGKGTNQFFLPHGIFVDTAGKIYVGDFGNSRIVRMDDMTGAGWVELGTLGSGTKQFSMPHGMFVDTARKIYVADPSNNRI